MTIRKRINFSIRTTAVISLLTMLAVLANFSQSSAKITQQTVEFPAPIDGFQLLEDGQGWVLLGNQLFWSTDAGRSWSDITPVGAETIRAVYFSDTQNGFLVDQEITTDGLITYTLRYTSDLGSSWSPRPLDSLSLYDPSASAEAVHIHFLDSTTGWIVLKQATSSNFNLGVIYRTSDGGQTWESYPGPSGEPVIFLNPSIGFMIGGPRMDTLFRTNDGGRSWFPVDLGLDKVAMLSLPTLLTQSVGHMAAATSSNSGTDLVILETADLGETWLEKSRYHLTDEAEKFPLIASFPGAIKAFSADQTVTFWQTTGDFAGTANQFSDSLSKVILTGTGHGWARSNRFTCTDPDDRATCVAETGLVHTANGGATWQSLTTPSVYIQIIVEEPIKLAREVDFHRDRTAIWQGQGFDQCKLSTLGNLQSWKTNSPLSTVNLYIGGAALACTNQPFFSNTEYISALSLKLPAPISVKE